MLRDATLSSSKPFTMVAAGTDKETWQTYYKHDLRLSVYSVCIFNLHNIDTFFSVFTT